jgi:rhodanese-related sulfurtransferase
MRIFVLLLLLVACSPNPIVQDLEPQQVSELLDKKEEMGLFVLNVHTPYEGKLDKTDATIEDWENIASHVDQLPADKNAPILVYCRSGRMSTSAVEQLKVLGYTNIYHLKGGMIAWDIEGLPIIDKKFD